MIFSIGDHIQQIKDRDKTQTRRPTDRYEVGKTYAIQSGRGKKADADGRIKILKKWPERRRFGGVLTQIIPSDAEAEGGYTPEEYENLYKKMYPRWIIRYAYKIEYVEGGNP